MVDATAKLGRTIAQALRSWAKEVGADEMAGDVMDRVREGFDVVRDHAAAGRDRTKTRRSAKKARSPAKKAAKKVAKKTAKKVRSVTKRKTARKTVKKKTARKKD
ncbi:MAG: hypothetical protein QF681_13390 [Vicinamibacterales bacterium]|nr:hypothetical protein [Vicinamibacterales bacterium]